MTDTASPRRRTSPRDEDDEKRLAILKTATELISARGVHRLKASHIINHESSPIASPSGFYRRFDDVTGVIDALTEQLNAKAIGTILGVFEEDFSDPGDLTDALADRFVVFFEQNSTYMELWPTYRSKLENRRAERAGDYEGMVLLADRMLQLNLVPRVSPELHDFFYVCWRLGEALLFEAFDAPNRVSAEQLIDEAKHTIRLRIANRPDLFDAPQ